MFRSLDLAFQVDLTSHISAFCLVSIREGFGIRDLGGNSVCKPGLVIMWVEI